MVTAISFATFTALQKAPGPTVTLTPMVSNVRAANNSKMKVYGLCVICVIDSRKQGFPFQVKALVCHLNTQAILGMDVLGNKKACHSAPVKFERGTTPWSRQ